jgi:hypothetical protein
LADARFSAIAQTLASAIESEDPARPFPASGHFRYLRAAQFRAFETYWYLRLRENTRLAPDARRAVPSNRLRRDDRAWILALSALMTSSVAERTRLNSSYRRLGIAFADDIVPAKETAPLRRFVAGAPEV